MSKDDSTGGGSSSGGGSGGGGGGASSAGGNGGTLDAFLTIGAAAQRSKQAPERAAPAPRKRGSGGGGGSGSGGSGGGGGTSIFDGESGSDVDDPDPADDEGRLADPCATAAAPPCSRASAAQLGSTALLLCELGHARLPLPRPLSNATAAAPTQQQQQQQRRAQATTPCAHPNVSKDSTDAQHSDPVPARAAGSSGSSAAAPTSAAPATQPPSVGSADNGAPRVAPRKRKLSLSRKKNEQQRSVPRAVAPTAADIGQESGAGACSAGVEAGVRSSDQQTLTRALFPEGGQSHAGAAAAASAGAQRTDSDAASDRGGVAAAAAASAAAAPFLPAAGSESGLRSMAPGTAAAGEHSSSDQSGGYKQQRKPLEMDLGSDSEEYASAQDGEGGAEAAEYRGGLGAVERGMLGTAAAQDQTDAANATAQQTPSPPAALSLLSYSADPSGREWACPRCTFANRLRSRACEACEAPKPAAAALLELPLQGHRGGGGGGGARSGARKRGAALLMDLGSDEEDTATAAAPAARGPPASPTRMPAIAAALLPAHRPLSLQLPPRLPPRPPSPQQTQQQSPQPRLRYGAADASAAASAAASTVISQTPDGGAGGSSSGGRGGGTDIALPWAVVSPPKVPAAVPPHLPSSESSAERAAAPSPPRTSPPQEARMAASLFAQQAEGGGGEEGGALWWTCVHCDGSANAPRLWACGACGADRIPDCTQDAYGGDAYGGGGGGGAFTTQAEFRLSQGPSQADSAGDNSALRNVASGHEPVLDSASKPHARGQHAAAYGSGGAAAMHGNGDDGYSGASVPWERASGFGGSAPRNGSSGGGSSSGGGGGGGGGGSGRRSLDGVQPPELKRARLRLHGRAPLSAPPADACGSGEEHGAGDFGGSGGASDGRVGRHEEVLRQANGAHARSHARARAPSPLPPDDDMVRDAEEEAEWDDEHSLAQEQHQGRYYGAEPPEDELSDAPQQRRRGGQQASGTRGGGGGGSSGGHGGVIRTAQQRYHTSDNDEFEDSDGCDENAEVNEDVDGGDDSDEVVDLTATQAPLSAAARQQQRQRHPPPHADVEELSDDSDGDVAVMAAPKRPRMEAVTAPPLQQRQRHAQQQQPPPQQQRDARFPHFESVVDSTRRLALEGLPHIDFTKLRQEPAGNYQKSYAKRKAARAAKREAGKTVRKGSKKRKGKAAAARPYSSKGAHAAAVSDEGEADGISGGGGSSGGSSSGSSMTRAGHGRALSCCISEIQTKGDFCYNAGPAFAVNPAAAYEVKAWAGKFMQQMHSNYTSAALFQNSLKTQGANTDKQLENFYRRCVTSGATIHIGILGGSISVDKEGYVGMFANRVREMCPSAYVAVHSGARNAAGSLTLGMCASTAMLTTKLDLFVADFTLNDSYKYKHTIKGIFTSTPYEIMLRNVLTQFEVPPAVFNLYFWGGAFTYDTQQDELDTLAKLYSTTGISLRDLVWPFYTSGTLPFSTKDHIVKDIHHPNRRVCQLTGDLLVLYMAERFVGWVDTALAGQASAVAGTFPVALPPPRNAQLADWNFTFKFDCALVADAYRANGRTPYMVASNEMAVVTSPEPCVTFGSANASAVVPVHSNQGRVFFSNCMLETILFPIIGGTAGAAMQVYNVDGGGRVPLALRPMLNGSIEMFTIDPPLTPGWHMLEEQLRRLPLLLLVLLLPQVLPQP
ncbi:hypothetical protein JKP88DRAFT_350200 [Tribonema minus]|uniref:RanBP2-type domain-containing protein n=1 Tax=Tribonema minus TaxID=303371 RepID=A0A836CAR2_9STRA|nr:hypothetical protein JKP88DRAFT_350200 [Tribonema minus]